MTTIRINYQKRGVSEIRNFNFALKQTCRKQYMYIIRELLRLNIREIVVYGGLAVHTMKLT